ncbi:MAG: hypothetical protein R3C68_04955 [Myxococcota bacterium]
MRWFPIGQQLRLRFLGLTLALVSVVACEGTLPKDLFFTAEIDTLLTQRTFIGGDPVLAVRVDGCSAPEAAQVFANTQSILTLEQITLLSPGVDEQDGNNPVPFFNVRIPQEKLPLATFGLPVEVDVTVEVLCDGQPSLSEPFEMRFLPTSASLVPPFNPRRFWASQTQGDILACEDSSLNLYSQGTTLAQTLALEFPCVQAELSGFPDDRRYLIADGLGVSAIAPTPAVLWTRGLDLQGARVSPENDPIILYKEGALRYVVALDRDSGANVFDPVLLDRVPLGPPARNAAGDILVLEAQRPGDFSSLTYYVRRFDSGGQFIDVQQVAHYAWNAPSFVAEFDFTSESIYIAAATQNREEQWLQKIDVSTGDVIWETSSALPWSIPLGESFERLLVASDNAFAWLDPQDGTVLTSAPFAPDSGNRFLRASVEADGSIVMLADSTPDVAQGLYLFAPNGDLAMQLSGPDLVFRWLTTGWGDGVLLSYLNEIHLLHATQTYVALRDTP